MKGQNFPETLSSDLYFGRFGEVDQQIAYVCSEIRPFEKGRWFLHPSRKNKICQAIP
jgi:hypothetical protein